MKKAAGKKPDRKNRLDTLHAVAVASGAGFSLLSCIAVGVWLGLKCDEYLGTSPFGLIFFSLLGAVSGLYSVVRQMMGKP